MKIESKFAVVTFVAVFGAGIGVLAALDDGSSDAKTNKVEISRDDTSTTTIVDSGGNEGGSGKGKGSGKSGGGASGGGSGTGGGGSGQTSETTLPLGITLPDGVTVLTVPCIPVTVPAVTSPLASHSIFTPPIVIVPCP